MPEPPAEPAPPAVLLLGDRRLRQVARALDRRAFASHAADFADLHRVLADFRRRHGFGRAVSAPQIGLGLRVIALELGDGPLTMVNPRVTWRSDERFELWDDCMSFPDLLVRVSRHASISVEFLDADATPRSWTRLAPEHAELLQHEIDHLDGILAVDRAVDRDALRLRDAGQGVHRAPG